MPAKNQRHIKWALENVPLLRARGEEEAASIVSRALDETLTLRVGVSLILAVLTVAVGWIIEADFRAEESSRTSSIVTGAILMGLLAYVGTIVSDFILHKRITDLANA